VKPVAVELYDYKKDALERDNLAKRPEYKEVLKNHERWMNEFLTTQKHSW
jgi:hypothetical protein